jgi:large subunit ribosomal protein L17
VKGKDLRIAWKEEHDVVHILCDSIAPAFKERSGGYTRILRLGQRQGDAGQVAILEWVDFVATDSKEAAAVEPSK